MDAVDDLAEDKARIALHQDVGPDVLVEVALVVSDLDERLAACRDGME